MGSDEPKESCVRWAADPPWEGAIFGERDAHCKVQGFFSAVSFAKTAEPIELPFGLWTRVGPRKHKFNRIRQPAPTCLHGRAHRPPGEYDWTTRMLRQCMTLCQITLTTSYYYYKNINYITELR